MFSAKKVTVLAFVGFSLAAALAPVRAEGLSLEQVIANVEANEQLYANLEVILKDTYELVAKKDFEKLVTKQITRTRTVVQGPMFYLKVGGKQDLLSSKSFDLNRLYGFDGQITRFYERGGPTTDPGGKHQAIVNINHKRLNPCDVFAPHTWILSKSKPCTAPLSLWLRGGKALRTYPGNGRYNNWDLKTFLEGEEQVEGLRCIKLRSETWEIEPKQFFNTRIHLWLAIERNYLPVKYVAYVMFENPDIALGEARVWDFREIGPDIWLPFEREHIFYDHIALRSDKSKRLVNYREKETVELAKLNPNYDVSFFRDIEIPDDAFVYEIKNDKIVNSYRQEGTQQDAKVRRGYLWWSLALVVSLLVILLAWRTYRSYKSLPIKD